MTTTEQLFELQQKVIDAINEFKEFRSKHYKEITKEALDTANSGDDKYYNFHKGIKNSEDFKTISIEFTYINGAKEKWPHNMYLTENGWVTKDEFWSVSNNENCGNCGYNVPERAFIENILSKMPI